MEGIREIGVIFAAEFWRTLRSARVVVLLVLYLMFTAAVFLGCGSPGEREIVHADGEIFEAIVRSQVSDSAKLEARKLILGG